MRLQGLLPKVHAPLVSLPVKVGLNLNFEFDSAQKFLMNLNFRFSKVLNLNFGFSKIMNLNFECEV